MDHAHRQGVIHRDLRPGNVLVTEQGMVKVADFGTSRFLEIAAHGTTVIGSPPYMAPEQFQGKAVFASDIYSLGVTMYQMLTGIAALQHAGAGRPRAADARRADDAAARRGTRRSRKGISDIVMKAMAPDIASRYQRAADCSTRCSRRARPAAPPAAPAVRRRRAAAARRPWRPAPLDSATASENVDDIQARLKAREAAAGALLLALPQAAPRPHRHAARSAARVAVSRADDPPTHRSRLSRQFMPAAAATDTQRDWPMLHNRSKQAMSAQVAASDCVIARRSAVVRIRVITGAIEQWRSAEPAKSG